MLVHSRLCGTLIGKGGATIRSFNEDSRAVFNISPPPTLPGAPGGAWGLGWWYGGEWWVWVWVVGSRLVFPSHKLELTSWLLRCVACVRCGRMGVPCALPPQPQPQLAQAAQTCLPMLTLPARHAPLAPPFVQA